MAQRLSTSFVNTNIPGTYIETTTKSTPAGIGTTGDIVIIGEADGGADYTIDSLKDNFFTPTQVDRVQAKYLRGPIVDAMRALASPSNDTEITGAPNRVYIVKTNAGQKASASVDNYGTLSDRNFGKDGNKYFFQVTQIEQEVAPRLETGELDFSDPDIYDGLEFKIRLNGQAASTITLGVGTHNTLQDLADEIDGLLPAGISCQANNAAGSIVFEMNEDLNANQKGSGKSFEIIDSNGDLAALAIVESLVVSSQEPEVQFAILRQDTNTNEAYVLRSEIALEIGYEGNTAVASISNSNILTTNVTGGVGENLTIDLAQYPTLADVVTFINSQAGYKAQVNSNSINLSPVNLDKVSAIGICSSIESRPGRIKRAVHNTRIALAQSPSLELQISALTGIPSEMNLSKFLTGGAKGATTAADIVNSLSSLEGIKVNFVVPLFSRNASEDIAEGLTDSGSTYSIDAINFAVRSHVLKMSTVKLKRNRVAMLSKWANYNESKTHAQSLSSFRVNLCFQKSSQVDSSGIAKENLPWHSAVIAAGMQSAGFYKSITNKFANIISYRDPAGFDSGNPGDVEDAIDAGMMFLQQETAGSKWVVDQTTYGFDGNFVYNSMQAVYLSDVLAIQLGEDLTRFAVGKSLADINAPAISAFISRKMGEYLKLKIVGASDDAPLGFKNLKVSIRGPVADVALEAKLSTTLLFIPVQLELSQIVSEA
jgi:hypothetical protein